MSGSNKSLVPYLGIAFSSFCVLVAAASCGGDDTGGGTGASGAAGVDAGVDSSSVGGSAGIGGSSGAGNTGNTGGSGMAGGGGSAGSDCVHTGPPAIDPASLPECTLCENARCVPASLIPNPEDAERLADCPDGMSKCTPDVFIETLGNFLLDECRSLSGVEGRCVSLCVPEVAAQADRLPQDVCASDQKCAPCYDPTSGEDTGSCRISCDEGPKEPPVTFDKCCGGNGTCIPKDVVPSEFQDQLGPDTCTGADILCVPDEFNDPAGFVPDSCRSIADSEGRCIPECIPQVNEQKDRLPKDSCKDGFLCAPCYDPITGMETGSCGLSNDPGPQEPPVTFDKCCSDIGVCVPTSLIPPDDAAQLGTDTCTGTDVLCAPQDFTTSGGFVPATCQSWGGGEGRCIPECIPQIQAQKDRLTQSSCPALHLCAPCYDPTNGMETGACGISNDPGPANPPYTFPKCCNTAGGIRGTCVPKQLAGSQGDSLPVDTCPTGTPEDFVCAPDEKVQDQSYKFPSCLTESLFVNNQPGACVPECLVSGLQGLVLGQSTCGTGEKCAPCVEPGFPLGSGQPTGACD